MTGSRSLKATVTMSWRLARTAWRALRNDPEMLAIPAVALIFHLLIALTALAAAVAWPGDGPAGWQLAAFALPFVAASGAAAVYFEGALVAAAYERLSGGDPTVPSALRDAAVRFPQLVTWGAIDRVVGATLRAIQNRVPAAASIAVWLLGTAWHTGAYLIVPAIVIDHDSVTDAAGRSLRLLRDNWGPGVTLNWGFGTVLALAGFALGLLAGGISIVMPVAATLAVTIALLTALAALFLLASTLQPYLKAALYLWVNDSTAIDGFDPDLLAEAFTDREHRRI